ncbi:dipeptide ABC transporter ATP-binding protein [Oceaniserpentilla sp. 4NH20-0058]|uniref:ABC transporter ATP-binding protein n=1 Tax=Oceaniserpentilla sp. 4NH20-0058 TaxID=3127660 RepID=UPI003106AA9C
MSQTDLLTVSGLYKAFPVKKDTIWGKSLTLKAVNDIHLTIKAGETLGIVGESGCGKSTLAKTIARLYEPTDGSIEFKGHELTQLSQKELRPIRPKIQYVFQDPYESLNPRHTIGSILEEPFVIHTQLDSEQRQAKVRALLEKVGLPDSAINKYPHEFSGGQRQRIGIARAIALEPELLICDEPVSALDVSVQSQIINLLIKLQQEMNLAILFIAHDLAVVKHISDRISVMYLGSIVESATSDELFKQPMHPYTHFLLDAIPSIRPNHKRDKLRIQGELPSPISPPTGCLFNTRCPLANEQCLEERPKLIASDKDDHLVACHHRVRATQNWQSPWG